MFHLNGRQYWNLQHAMQDKYPICMQNTKPCVTYNLIMSLPLLLFIVKAMIRNLVAFEQKLPLSNQVFMIHEFQCKKCYSIAIPLLLKITFQYCFNIFVYVLIWQYLSIHGFLVQSTNL